MDWRVLSFNPIDGSLQHQLDLFGLGALRSIHSVESLGHIVAITRAGNSNFNGERLKHSFISWCEVRHLDFANKRFTNVTEEIDGQILTVGAVMSMSIRAPKEAGATMIYFSKSGTFEDGMCKFMLGSLYGFILPPDGGIYELPQKQVDHWPISYTENSRFADGLELACYLRTPRLCMFMNSLGEWWE